MNTLNCSLLNSSYLGHIKESTHLLEGESRCGSLMLGQLLPFLFSDMFGHQTVGRLDFGEGFSLGQANKKSNWVQ